ncbi:MAG: hypothetical protein ABWZ52_00935 [Acidimicrobiales bacterium]
MTSHAKCFARVTAVALGLVVVTAAPAGADPAGPSDFRSEVTGIVPDVDGVTAEIRGGDSFLLLTVDEGRTVIVEGYRGEPYLRFQPDGTVERNRLSTATYLNDDRQGEVDLPAAVTEAGPDAEPEWEAVADGGTYAWHDHRVHWMAESSPPVDRGEQVEGEYDPWRVPITVDEVGAEVQGILVYEESVSALPYLGLAVIVAGLLGFYGRGLGLRFAASLLAVVALAAVVVGWAHYSSTPDGGGSPLHWALAVVALLTAIGAVVLAHRPIGVVLALASVATLSGWALFRIEVLFKPVLPTELPAALDRIVVALALGVSVGAAVVAVLSGGLRLPELADDAGPTASRSS